MERKLNILWLLIVLIAVQNHCIVVDNEYDMLPPGIWRAALEIEPPKIDTDRDFLEEGLPTATEGGVYLPFNFEVIDKEDGSVRIEIINGSERIAVDDVKVSRSKTIAKDTFRINFPVYDSYIFGTSFEGVMQGYWVRNNRENYRIPFTAHYGTKNRFDQIVKMPEVDLSGKWACQFEIETDSPYPAIGEFKQDKEIVSGTFRTETGDYRYLEGSFDDSRMQLSVFDGAHAFLFDAKLKGDSLIGVFYSGNHYKTLWSGQRDESVTIKSPDSLTRLVSEQPFDFSFPNTAGQIKSLSDYNKPVKIVQILGTWCPNCRDETKFLVDYLKNNASDKVDVIALAYESYRDRDKCFAAIERYQDHFQMNYDMLLAGYRDKGEASETLPMLNEIISYPTLIFIDKDNRVRKIHTGFNGPATSKYEDFVKEFQETVEELVGEV